MTSLPKIVDANCFYCGAPASQMDHFTPRSRGGSNRLSNLVPACRPCNQDKSDMTVQEWYAIRIQEGQPVPPKWSHSDCEMAWAIDHACAEYGRAAARRNRKYPPDGLCIVDGCIRKRRKFGRCKFHHGALLRLGPRFELLLRIDHDMAKLERELARMALIERTQQREEARLAKELRMAEERANRVPKPGRDSSGRFAPGNHGNPNAWQAARDWTRANPEAASERARKAFETQDPWGPNGHLRRRKSWSRAPKDPAKREEWRRKLVEANARRR